jgi:O-antigen ligase
MVENQAFGLGFGRDWEAFNPEIESKAFDPWPIRAPHNFNVTVFSRMGMVGFLLWVSILAFGIGGLLLRAWRARFAPARQQEIGVWILVLLATWGNASFGVLMEGPVLGVWFWFALGFAWGRSSGVWTASAPAYPVPAWQVPVHAGSGSERRE